MRFAVTYRLGNSHIGGGYTYVDSIARELADQVGNTTHTLLFIGIGGAMPRDFRQKSVDLFDLRLAPRAMAAVALAAMLRRLRRYPFVGLQRYVECFMQARVASALRQKGIEFLWSLGPFVHTMEIPFAVTVWDLGYRRLGFFPELSSRGEWRAREHIYLEMLHRAVYVVASNEVGRREIEASFHVPSSKIMVLPHFTPRWALNTLPEIACELQAKHGLEPRKFILYPAQFWPHKNHIRIIEAVALRRRRAEKPLKVVFVGSDHGNLTYIEEVVRRLGLKDDVCFPGFVSQEELAWLYRNAFCLVYASMLGPENLPPLEAFAFGCPVICGAYDGAIEQLADAALYFECTASAQLADRLSEMENSDLRVKLTARGNVRAAEWTPQKYVSRIFELLDRFEPTRRCWGRD